MADWRVLLVEQIDGRAVEWLRAKAEVCYPQAFDEDGLIEAAREADAVVFRAIGQGTRRMMEGCPRLKVMARHGVGVDNIDVAAATELGVQVVYTPLANLESVAEHAIGMMLGLAKNIVRCDRAMRRRDWDARAGMHGIEVRGKTLGIVGAGRIGTRLAEIASRGLGMRVRYCDVIPNAKLDDEVQAVRCDLETLLRESDFVSLHVPLLASTRYLIGERELRLMKPGAFLLNLSRGPVVDERALVEALRAGTIAGAGLDVFEQEPLPADSPLLEMENVILTPHNASHTAEALLAMANVVRDIVAVLEGRAPDFPVNHPASLRR